MNTRFRKQWATPLLLAVVTIIGLISALVADGVWDALSWLLLAAPIAATVWCMIPRSGTRP